MPGAPVPTHASSTSARPGDGGERLDEIANALGRQPLPDEQQPPHPGRMCALHETFRLDTVGEGG